ncbi:MAG: hypothetical protein O2816_20435, partial [Planctomycetota bacterium]|nr:hypothetical protein [Planctomycetota bacterium]
MDIESMWRSYERGGVAGLEVVRDAVAPAEAWVEALIAAAADPRACVPATWLLRAYLQAGLELDRSSTAALARRLERVALDDARLHLCQSVAHLEIPTRNAGQVARFIRTAAAGDQKFTRAWAVDGLARLARQHPRYGREAGAALRRAARDPAASVRAR